MNIEWRLRIIGACDTKYTKEPQLSNVRHLKLYRGMKIYGDLK